MDRTIDREGTLDLPWGAGSKREVNGVVNSGVAMGRGRRDPPPPHRQGTGLFWEPIPGETQLPKAYFIK